MDLGNPPFNIENLLESNTLKSRFLVRGLALINFAPDGFPCVVLWRPEVFGCMVEIPPEACNRFIHSSPSRY